MANPEAQRPTARIFVIVVASLLALYLGASALCCSGVQENLARVDAGYTAAAASAEVHVARMESTPRPSVSALAPLRDACHRKLELGHIVAWTAGLPEKIAAPIDPTETDQLRNLLRGMTNVGPPAEQFTGLEDRSMHARFVTASANVAGPKSSASLFADMVFAGPAGWSRWLESASERTPNAHRATSIAVVVARDVRPPTVVEENDRKAFDPGEALLHVTVIDKAGTALCEGQVPLRMPTSISDTGYFGLPGDPTRKLGKVFSAAFALTALEAVCAGVDELVCTRAKAELGG